MKILFITLYDIVDINNSGIYEDLLREFIKNGHEIFVVSPVERRSTRQTECVRGNGYTILKVKTGNVQKVNFIEKGIATILLERQFVKAVKKYYHDEIFDFVIYSTPPITIGRVVEYVKKRYHAQSYLLLKDIFPQNAVDLGILSVHGLKGVAWQYFRRKERHLYELSDNIGCMSTQNVKYLLEHNPYILKENVEICPNCIEVKNVIYNKDERVALCQLYGLPLDKKIFVYGGNLGKPQGIDFLIQCLDKYKNHSEIYFLIIGNGTEYIKLQKFIGREKPKNIKLLPGIAREDYDKLVGYCDVGLIFLDSRFTIPNFPSRILSYMQARLPVLAVTDRNTDVGTMILEGGFGWWAPSDDIEEFKHVMEQVLSGDLKELGEKAYQYLATHYTAEIGYEIISSHFNSIC